MSNIFDIAKFDSYKEDNRREVKKAKGGLPISLWESYSAMANTTVVLLFLVSKNEMIEVGKQLV